MVDKMLRNILIYVVLSTFVGTLLVSSIRLACPSCRSPDSCKEPATEICNQTTANASNAFLTTLHTDVPEVNNTDNFHCGSFNYRKYPNQFDTYAFKGCIYADLPLCELTFNSELNEAWIKRCAWSTPNELPDDDDDAAGSLAQSTYTMMASFMILGLLKLWRV
ncbi:maker455 [Drosophila busckii]|uniref:Maker455 n=1 Tax=Drosophila busckii TaxID=30019 RepID=A0A0M4E827_DROBS|nr:uncharacterized protein LOC108605753 [Drosophila busckii]ALC39027.1 maker455 [Drosophila busckii]